MYKAIPCMDDPKRYEKIEFTDSSFLEIVTNEVIDVKMQYPLLQMRNAEERCFLRKGVYERLLEAQKYLPEGVRLRIWDAWRPFDLQQELYEKYSENIIREFGLKNVSEEERKRVIAGFVSEPVANRNCPPVHTTGGAVDVTLIDANGKELNMGTIFDSFEEASYTSYFENSDDEEVKQNRRMLYWAMTDAGFTNLPSEWWHFDYGDRFWAYYRKQPANYEGVFTKEEVLLKCERIIKEQN